MSEISINIDTEQPRCRHDFVWELDEAGRDRIIESQREIAEILGMALDTWLSRGVSMMLKCFDDPRPEVRRGAAMTIVAHVLQRPASDRSGVLGDYLSLFDFKATITNKAGDKEANVSVAVLPRGDITGTA